MPKLDLTRAIQIKGAGGNIAKLKGSGFLWEAPYLAGGEHPDLIADFERERYLHSGEVQAAFSDLATFARASGATYTDATGTIQTVASNVPRIGHHVWDGSAWVNKGLLLESEARTNLVTYSEDFTDASWVKLNTTVTANSTTSPDGTQTADKLVETADTGSHQISDTIGTATSGVSYTLSCFAKAAERNFAYLQFDGAAFPGVLADRLVFFNLSTGAVGTTGASWDSVGIEEFGDGWYRIHGTMTADAAADFAGYINIASADGSSSYAGDGTSGIYIWGAQLEVGSTRSSHIPTSGATATRAAETLTIPAANLPYPEPVVIGEELVTNGTFDTDVSGWSAGGSASIASVSQQLQVASTTAYGRAEQNVGVLSDDGVYLLSVDFVSTTGAGEKADVKLTNPHGTFSVPLGASPGTHEVVFRGSSSFNTISVGDYNDAGAVTVFDNISVKEINPLAVSIAMEGTMTYADEGKGVQEIFLRWQLDGNNRIQNYLDTNSTNVGQIVYVQSEGGITDATRSAFNAYSPGVNVPFNIASRHGSTFINGAVGGTALTADTTPVALPDLSATDLQLGYDFMGTIKTFRMWGADIGDTGISGASS